MISLQFTDHARQRLRQRGRRERDVGLILEYGTAVKGGGVILLEQDVERVGRELRDLAVSIDRLSNWKVVLAGDRVVTIYPARRLHTRRLRHE